MSRTIQAVFWVMLLSTSAAMAAGAPPPPVLLLTDNGLSPAPIVVPESAPPRTRSAAADLAVFIEKISGAGAQVIEGLPDPLPERAIWVGYQPALNKIFPQQDFNFKHPEEILIAANTNHLVIAGRDRWDPENNSFRVGRWTFEDWQSEYGTANAVYTFLQDYLDVRWLWPGDLGLDIVEQEQIAFTPFEYRYHPQFRARADIFRFSAVPDHPYGVAHGGRGTTNTLNWVIFQRLQLDSLRTSGGHPFSGWWERFHLTHPEYFALQPDGSRAGGEKPYPGAGTVKLCKSNPAVWAQVLDDWAEIIASNPNQHVFDASFNDGGFSGFCICENCQAWDHPDGELRRFSWHGVSQDYVSLSDRLVIWANTLARMHKQRHPDRDDYVLISAYGHSWSPPVAAVPDDNVIVSSVHSFLTQGDHPDRMSPAGITKKRQLADWAAATPNLVWRPNLGARNGMPTAVLGRVIDNMQFVAGHGVIGFYFDTIWEHWVTHGPMYYLLAQMAWNPGRDGRAILDDYYRRGFGPAAGMIGEYWALLEQVQMQGGEYDDEFFRRADRCFERAQHALADAPEKYRARLAYMRMGYDYVRLVTENRALIKHYEASGDQQAAAQARANWREIERIAAKPATLNRATVRFGDTSLRGVYLALK